MTTTFGFRAGARASAWAKTFAARLQVLAAIVAITASTAVDAGAQEPQGDPKPPKPYNPPPLFAEERPLEMTLTAPFRKLRGDRRGTPPYRPATISYDGESGRVTVPARARTRGIWRRLNCDTPPILLNLTKDSAKKTVFARLDRVRLSLHCRENDDHEQYVLKEYQIYRVQRLLTPLTFNVRLARVTYIDSEKKDTVARRWAFLQEQDDAFAERIGAKLTTIQGAGPDDLEPYESAFFGVFQYFVGNSDFSVRALHNVVLLYKEPVYIPVARDFDWSGAVNPRYAKPNPILKIRTISQRIMRGYCAPAAEYEKVFALFREKKDAIYALYRDSIAAPMKPDIVDETLKYFDEFYKTINDPRSAKSAIVGACLGGSA